MMSNPYLVQIHKVLPRILALFDVDESSSTYGMGDRYHWAWKLIDFGNGTFQGAVNGIARLIKHQMLPDYISEVKMLERVDAMFAAARTLTRKNGSLEEAMPYEGSFCVTALVAYDLLTAVELLRGNIWDENRSMSALEVVRPMIGFLMRTDETHALISNHLATAAIALYKWNELTGEPTENRGKLFLDRILHYQSPEGWFREYEGADPGYQSLCTYYLADLAKLRPELNLAEPLQRSVEFLKFFAHPDGSFGGHYGSRNTRFYYPAGLECLGDTLSAARALSDFMLLSIKEMKTVVLEVMDEPNLIPMFNCYCWAAALFSARSKLEIDSSQKVVLPSMDKVAFRRVFEDAGLVIDKGEHHYSIVSWHKGGIVSHFNRQGSFVDAGVLARNESGVLYSSQAYCKENSVEIDEDTLVVRSRFTKMPKQLPGPFQFILLRLLCLTLMRSYFWGSLVKKLLVRLLITGKKSVDATNERVFVFGEECLVKDEHYLEGSGLQAVKNRKPFTAIHMASQGYWQHQDEVL